MTKAEFVSAVKANNDNFTKSEIEELLGTILDTVVENVANGEKVNFVGFGSFEKHKRAARTGVNPSTGKPIEIAEKNVPAFKAGKMFKDAVAENK